MAKAGKKNRCRLSNRGNQATKTIYKSKVAKLEDEVFDIGALSKLLKTLRIISKRTIKLATTS
jgi:hypothetical protein